MDTMDATDGEESCFVRLLSFGFVVRQGRGGFSLGRVYATKTALRALSDAGMPVRDLIARHARGDRGDAEFDPDINDPRMEGCPNWALSSYRLPTGAEVTVISAGNVAWMGDADGESPCTTVTLRQEL